MREHLRRTLRAGMRFLALAQSEDGAWRDFQLCGAESDAWVSGYVIAALSDTATFAPLEPSLQCARAFLVGDVREGGWGFNQHAPVDADSTSWALRALDGRHHAAVATGIAGLLRHQKRDGGFSCFVQFTDASAWTRSHPDISAVALQALLRHGVREPADRVAAYIRAARSADGTWPAFWYRGRWYTTLHAIDALRAYGGDAAVEPAQPLERPALADPFQLAQWLEASRFSGDGAMEGVAALVDAQRCDGRWVAGAPYMMPNPWNHDARDPDIAVRDQRGIFTTATVLRALAAVREDVAA